MTDSAKRIEDVLEEEGIFVSTSSGVSMYPMLRNRRDTIIIEKYEGRLKKFDVPLYKRGDSYVLHRIVKVLPDSYIICGDNCMKKEYGITDEQIIGVLTGFFRGTRRVTMNELWYKLYVRLAYITYPVRAAKGFVKQVLLSVYRKCFKKGVPES